MIFNKQNVLTLHNQESAYHMQCLAIVSKAHNIKSKQRKIFTLVRSLHCARDLFYFLPSFFLLFWATSYCYSTLHFDLLARINIYQFEKHMHFEILLTS